MTFSSACSGETYVGVMALDNDSPPRVYAMCNDNLATDCGFSMQFQEDPADWGITSEEMKDFNRAHEEHIWHQRQAKLRE